MIPMSHLNALSAPVVLDVEEAEGFDDSLLPPTPRPESPGDARLRPKADIAFSPTRGMARPDSMPDRYERAFALYSAKAANELFS